MISEMAGFQIFDTISKKINPGNQICGCNHCVPHWTKQFRLILSLPWRRDKSSQTNRLGLAWDSTLERTAVFDLSHPNCTLNILELRIREGKYPVL